MCSVRIRRTISDRITEPDPGQDAVINNRRNIPITAVKLTVRQAAFISAVLFNGRSSYELIILLRIEVLSRLNIEQTCSRDESRHELVA